MQPTLVEQKKKEVAPTGVPQSPTPLFLNRTLGLEDIPFRTYGWLQNSFTGNASGTPRDRSNFSVFPNRPANQRQGNQYYLVLENPLEPDDMINSDLTGRPPFSARIAADAPPRSRQTLFHSRWTQGRCKGNPQRTADRCMAGRLQHSKAGRQGIGTSG